MANRGLKRAYPMGPPQRDELIMRLRHQGFTYKEIAERVDMDESGVRRAVERIRSGGFGTGVIRS